MKRLTLVTLSFLVNLKYLRFRLRLSVNSRMAIRQLFVTEVSGGSRIFPRGGREPSRGGVNTPNFPENCMKSKEFGRPGGGRASLTPPLDPPMEVTELPFIRFGKSWLNSRMAIPQLFVTKLPFSCSHSNSNGI